MIRSRKLIILKALYPVRFKIVDDGERNALAVSEVGSLIFNSNINFFQSSAFAGTFVSDFWAGIVGLVKGGFIRFSFKGVGFRLQVTKNFVVFDMGFSHRIVFQLGQGVYVRRIRRYEFVVFGFEKHILRRCAFELQRLRFPDSYRGKGLHFSGEKIFYKVRKDTRRR